VRSNVRELEGLLNRVIAFSSLTGKPLSLELARETLKDILPQDGRKPTAAEIIKFVARHYGLKVLEIKSKNNAKQISFPRQVAMYLCKRLTDLSFPEIGKQFNDKHHSTVMYSVEKIQQLRRSAERPGGSQTTFLWKTCADFHPPSKSSAPVLRVSADEVVGSPRLICPLTSSHREPYRNLPRIRSTFYLLRRMGYIDALPDGEATAWKSASSAANSWPS
jgi:hypothetical protein